MADHILEGDSLCNYWCSCEHWRYAHVGFGEPDEVAFAKYATHVRGSVTIYDV